MRGSRKGLSWGPKRTNSKFAEPRSRNSWNTFQTRKRQQEQNWPHHRDWSQTGHKWLYNKGQNATRTNGTVCTRWCLLFFSHVDSSFIELIASKLLISLCFWTKSAQIALFSDTASVGSNFQGGNLTITTQNALFYWVLTTQNTTVGLLCSTGKPLECYTMICMLPNQIVWDIQNLSKTFSSCPLRNEVLQPKRKIGSTAIHHCGVQVFLLIS